MGLASHFGDQAAYKCKKCGQTVALYTPSCPRCLDNTLVKTEKAPEAFRTVKEEIRDTRKPVHPVVPFAALVIVVALAVAVSTMFAPPRPESMTKPEPRPKVGSTAKSVHISNNQSSKRSKNSKAHGVSTATPKPATPMKLWEAGSDDEGGDP